jgi:hypothetical protein
VIVISKNRQTKAEKEHGDKVKCARKEQMTAKKKDTLLHVVRLKDKMAVDNNNASGAYPRYHCGKSLSPSNEL